MLDREERGGGANGGWQEPAQKRLGKAVGKSGWEKRLGKAVGKSGWEALGKSGSEALEKSGWEATPGRYKPVGVPVGAASAGLTVPPPKWGGGVLGVGHEGGVGSAVGTSSPPPAFPVGGGGGVAGTRCCTAQRPSTRRASPPNPQAPPKNRPMAHAPRAATPPHRTSPEQYGSPPRLWSCPQDSGRGGRVGV